MCRRELLAYWHLQHSLVWLGLGLGFKGHLISPPGWTDAISFSSSKEFAFAVLWSRECVAIPVLRSLPHVLSSTAGRCAVHGVRLLVPVVVRFEEHGVCPLYIIFIIFLLCKGGVFRPSFGAGEHAVWTCLYSSVATM